MCRLRILSLKREVGHPSPIEPLLGRAFFKAISKRKANQLEKRGVLNSQQAIRLIEEINSNVHVVLPFEHEISEELLTNLREKGYSVYAEISPRGQQVVIMECRSDP